MIIPRLIIFMAGTILLTSSVYCLKLLFTKSKWTKNKDWNLFQLVIALWPDWLSLQIDLIIILLMGAGWGGTFVLAAFRPWPIN